MTSETTNLTTVTPEDIALVERELGTTTRPLDLKDLAQKVAFAKTAGQRTQAVKKYDPDCVYEKGDFIYKDYDEPLTVGSKAVEHFQGAVILEVVGKTFFKHFNCDMLEVDYPGGGVFRKYIDYMKKTKTQVLLPANVGGANRAPETLPQGDDPRLTELPMTERDLKTLEKHLRTDLGKDPRVFGWDDRYQLAAKRVDIPEDKVKEIEAGFVESKLSAGTEDLVKKYFGLEASSDFFELTCLSLDVLLEKKYKKDFILLATAGWGKWHLKRILNALPDNLPVSAAMAKVPELDIVEKPELSIVAGFPIKVYLTWREILAGALKIPKSLSKELSHAREYTFTDTEDNKTYTLYYYPAANFFLGLKDFYDHANIPQGTSLTLEKTGPNTFNFWIKKSKKKIGVSRPAYDFEKDMFSEGTEDAFSFAEPNKIIYIERDTVPKLLAHYEQREERDLRELLILVFKDTALAGTSHLLHFLRAYHLVDMLRQTTQEDVEMVLLNSTEFAKSDKKKGMFYYQEPYVPKEEAAVAFGEEPYAPAEGGEFPGAEGFPEEGGFEPGAEELPGAELEPEVQAPAAEKPKAPAAPAATPAKKEKPFKKKKPKLEGEKAVRPKKSERRVIEEKIEEEESVQAALSAVKEKEEESVETRTREKKEEFKPAPKEEPKFGIFADLLKTALKKKEDKKPGEKPDEKPGEEPSDDKK